MEKATSLAIIITLAFGIMLTSAAISGASVVVFAQKNQTKTNVTPVGKQATKIINQTSIPANKITTTIQKKTESVGKVPLPSNQTKLSPPGSQAKLPPVSNKTTVAPAGKATTTIINKTSTPINVTLTNATTAYKQPQPQTSQATGNQTAAKQPQQQPAKPQSATGNATVAGKATAGNVSKAAGNATKVGGGVLSNLSNAVSGGLKGLGNLITGGKK